MLRSPGHSPRNLSPSPAPTSTPRPSSPTPSSASALAASSSKRRRPEVLDEDTYVAAIERIIERDFFPDLPRLRDRLDWLQAVRSRDPLLLRDAQLKILDRRRRLHRHAPARTPTPATSTALRSPSFLPTPSVAPSVTGEGEDAADADDDVEAALSLDDFFHRFTSEDNDSFSRILEKVNHRRRERYAHLLEPADAAGTPLLGEDAKRDRITDGYGTSGQPLSTLEVPKFTAKNLLMYHPADRGEAPLTDEELAHRLKGMTKEIARSNTRFHGKSDDGTREEEAAAILYAPVASTTPGGMAYHDPDKAKKYDLEDLRKTPNPFYVEAGKNADNGYSFVRTPSPAPGVDESPFMTWGEIDGTPLRLDPEGTPGDAGGSGSAHFKIAPPPVRDVKAHLLSRDAARKIKERTKMFHKPPLHSSPVRGGSASPRTLSPAAQKFVRNAIAKSSRAVDESLRASYRGSTPSATTPKTRFSTDPTMGSRSPSTRHGSTPPW